MDWFSNLPINIQQMLAPFLQQAGQANNAIAAAPSSPAAAAMAGAATGGPPAGGAASPAAAPRPDVQLTPMVAQGSLTPIASPFANSRFAYNFPSQAGMGAPNAAPGRVAPQFSFGG